MTPLQLIDQARRATGLDKFFSDSYREGLEKLIDGADRSKSLTAIGRAAMEQQIVNALSQRLYVDDWLARHPQLLDAPVQAPVFILGVPRTGTTLLVNLMALDPQRRPLWNWEHDNVLPPPEAAHMHDDPRIAAKQAVQQAMIDRGMVIPHFELAQDPNECWFLMVQDFKGLALEHMADLPGYTEWLYTQADMLPAYQHHKRVLQVLQSKAPGRWLLKLPSHALALDALFNVYPDARAVVLHRDPLVAAASYCSLTRIARGLICDRVDPLQVGEQLLPQFVAHAERLMAYRDAHPSAPFHDLHYHQLKADPVGELRRIYAFLGDELTPVLEQSVLAHLAERPQQPFGQHDYTLEEFGIDRSQLRQRLQAYGDRYGVKLS